MQWHENFCMEGDIMNDHFIKKEKIRIWQYANGIVVEVESEDKTIRKTSYAGNMERADMLNRCALAWLWLLENGMFSLKEGDFELGDCFFYSETSIEKPRSYDLPKSEMFTSQPAFVMDLIDKLDFELFDDKVKQVASDYIKLSSLERICHRNGMNLYDFFYCFENSLPLEKKQPFVPVETSASLYYKAISIIAKAKCISFRSLSKITKINRENLMSDRSDAYRGKRKTIEIRRLFTLCEALGVSITTVLALCHLLIDVDFYSDCMKKEQ